jgi:hypothetical protein
LVSIVDPEYLHFRSLYLDFAIRGGEEVLYIEKERDVGAHTCTLGIGDSHSALRLQMSGLIPAV